MPDDNGNGGNLLMDKRIGAQYYTIRDFCKTLEDFDASCKKVSEIGYKTVQLSAIGDFKPADVKAVLDKYSLEAVCTHRSGDEYENRLDYSIEFHKTIGCKIAGLGAIPGFSAEEENVKAFLEKYNPISEKLYENGLVFAYHNHHLEFERIGGKYVFDIIAENTDPDKFKFILDVYWLSYSGINPAKFIRKYKDRIACVHFKDIGIIDKNVEMFEVGFGNIDWDDVIAACEDANVEYALVEQDICRRDPFESLKMSYDYLSGKGFC